MYSFIRLLYYFKMLAAFLLFFVKIFDSFSNLKKKTAPKIFTYVVTFNNCLLKDYSIRMFTFAPLIIQFPLIPNVCKKIIKVDFS